mmetsp:Transcript_26997/g.37683  ORF Transcript_26997/g.37683 Transcript_26997/m.37683 type:complete len:136 (-) Transcript_26997:56-463(-)
MHHAGSKRSSTSNNIRGSSRTAQQDSRMPSPSLEHLRASEEQISAAVCERGNQRPPSQSFHHWTRSEKKRIGILSKRALDKGREWFLKSRLGMETEFVTYVEDSTSLENRLLMAFPSGEKSSQHSRDGLGSKLAR